MANITNPQAFKSLAAWRAWLRRNHARETELWVLLAKKHVPEPGLLYSDLVDEALCWGWIDGLVNRWDEDFRAVRVTPRKQRSVWSAINVDKVTRLEAEGRIQPAGRLLIEVAKTNGTWAAGVRRKTLKAPPALVRGLAKNPRAKAFFAALTPGRKRMALEWLEHAVLAETRARRVEKLIAACAAGVRLF